MYTAEWRSAFRPEREVFMGVPSEEGKAPARRLGVAGLDELGLRIHQISVNRALARMQLDQAAGC